MATLNTLLVNGDSVNGTRAWGSQSYLSIDEGISGADGTAIGDNTNANATLVTSFLLSSVNTDFDVMTAISWQIRYRVIGAQTNTRGLAIRVVKEADGTVLAAANSGGTFSTINANITNTTFSNSSITAFAYVNPTAVKADWDDARVEIQLSVTKSMAGDSNGVEVDTLQFTGTYTVATLSLTAEQGTFTLTGQNVSLLNNIAGLLDVAVVTGGTAPYGRSMVRTSSGIPYVVANVSGNIRVYKGNGVEPTSFSEQDAGNAPDNTRYLVHGACISTDNVIHIAYVDINGTSSTIRYVTFVTSTDTFSGDTLVEDFGATVPDAGYYFCAVAVDDSDIPHIVYNDADAGAIDRPAYTNRIGGSWKAVAYIDSAETANRKGQDFTFDNNIPIAIGLDNTGGDDTINVQVANANNASSWTPGDRNLSPDVAEERHLSFCLDSAGDRWIAYPAATTSYITLQQYNGTWQTAVTNSVVGTQPSVVAIGTKLYIFYTDSNDDLAFVTYDGTWGPATVLITGTIVNPNAKWTYYSNRGSDGALYEASATGIPEIDFTYQDGTGLRWGSLQFPSSGAYTLTAESGTYTLTGTAANLEWGHEVTADSQSYTLTGTDATLIKGKVITAEQGSFTLTGTDASLLDNRLLTADSTSYTLTGTDANLSKGYRLTADAGSFALSGTDAGLLRGYPLTAEQGSFVLSGTDATLLKDLSLVADSTSYTLTGTDAALVKGKVIAADSTSYALSGIDASLERGYPLAADQGSYTLTGTDVTLISRLTLIAEQGTYSLTGEDANLTRTYVLTADSGTFSVNGTDANLEQGHLLTADSTSYTLSGTDVTLISGLSIIAEQGTYTLSGIDVAFSRTYNLTAEQGSFVLSGTDATLLQSQILAADSTSYILSGTDANLEQGYLLTADVGSFTLSGTEASLEQGYAVTAEQGSYVLSGVDANLIAGQTITAEAGSFDLTGQNVNLLNNHVLTAEQGAFTLSGVDVTLQKDSPLTAESGTYTLSGTDANLEQGYRLVAESGAFTLTGTDANFSRTYVLAADSTSYTLTGLDVNLVYTPVGSYNLIADAGVFALVGTDASLTKQYVIQGDSGSFTETGQTVTLLYNRYLGADPSSYVLTGDQVNLLFNRALGADSATYNLTPQDPTLLFDRLLTADSEAYNLSGTDASLLSGLLVGADPGSFVLSGEDVTLTAGVQNTLVADSGSYTLTGLSSASTKWGRVLKVYPYKAV